MNMELHGTVRLDYESMEKLKDEVRKEALNEMKISGTLSDEVESFLSRISCKAYFKIIKNTLGSVLYNTEALQQLVWDYDQREYKILKAIYDLLSI